MAENHSLLQPGMTIKPEVSLNDAENILLEFYGLKSTSIQELNGYDDNNYRMIVENSSDNSYIDNVNSDGYVLKIMNTLGSLNPDYYDAQTKIQLHLNKQGICCPIPVLTKKGEFFFTKTFSTGNHIVRLLKFIPGTILHEVPTTQEILYQSGKFLAKLDAALSSFHHPVYDTLKSVWQLHSLPELEKFVFAVHDRSRQKIVEEVIFEFREKVLPNSKNMEMGLLHGDFNEQNILCKKNKVDEWEVSGILDFGESYHGCYLYELATAMAYLIIEGKSIDVGGYVLAGYCSIRKLTDLEFSLLKICVAARFCQTLVMGAYSFSLDPNNDYILTTSNAGWFLLEELWKTPQDILLQTWRNVDQLNA